MTSVASLVVGTGLAQLVSGEINILYLKMALDKENKEKEAPKIIGLNDGDAEKNEKVTVKPGLIPGLINKYRKFLFPAAIALGSLAIAFTAAMFLNSGPKADATETKVEQSSDANSPESPVTGLTPESKQAEIEKAADEEARKGYEIDTAAIMAELDFLNYVPEMEAEENHSKEKSGESSESSNEGITAQDSVDTLNWLEKEMTRLNEAKAEQDRRLASLQAVEAKVDAAMQKITELETSNTSNLARLYDGMRPEQVAKLFENLDDDAIMAILPKMKPANAAKIFAAMPPKRAAKISSMMISILEDK